VGSFISSSFIIRKAHRKRVFAGLVLSFALGGAACRSEPPPSANADTEASLQPPLAGSGNSSDAATASLDAQPHQASAAIPADLKLGRDAHYGLYLMGKKVGHAHVWDRASADGEPGLYTTGFDMKMSVGGAGQSNELTAAEVRHYAGAPGYALVETSFSSTAMGFRDERRAVPAMVGDKPVFRITRSIDNRPSEDRDVAASEDTLVSAMTLSPLTLDGAEVGVAKKVRVWSWEREGDETVVATIESMAKRMFSGVEQQVATMKVVYETSGIEGKSQVAHDGTMLEMTLGPGLVLKLEEESVAKSGVVGLDILGTGMVSPTKLGSPHAVARLELTLTGPAAVKVPSNPNQTVTTTLSEDGATATHEVVLVRGPGAAVLESELAEALGADATIDTTHPSIVAQANALTKDLESPRAKVQAIASWVHETLDKKLATHLPTASTILEKKVGDCTEHTWLSVALLRAVNIPARPVYGVGYTGDVEGVFAYHAWVEVALDGRWEMLDPTWGQAVADATHLRLGTSLGEVASSIGGLTVTRAEVKQTP